LGKATSLNDGTPSGKASGERDQHPIPGQMKYCDQTHVGEKGTSPSLDPTRGRRRWESV